ncbi:TetR/AcrR family transcriptional regulator [Arthrobacter cryoconiti]|uniref:TetR/AcrR family transcriptional regulator n=1 Tax=Arthrobacter cryoconiti TaxID=748907 RepID=A0ABV8QYL9_9MICC|nr:TetR/AcrR family transcriptional regulator [Arthrobacter cryoconiti]MCC9067436.1 TetR/AcrR family transcriptional regulator [Arthrobacter cryoconiti]
MSDPLSPRGNLREVLLEHAEQIVAKEGFEKLSLREVARIAGVSHGAPRFHFPTREDLLDAVSARGFDRLDETLRLAVATAGENFWDKTMSVSRSYIDFVLQEPHLIELMYSRLRANDNQEIESLPASKSHAYIHFERLLAEGQELGLIIDGPSEIIGLSYFSAIHGAATLIASGAVSVKQLDAVISNVTSYALRGIEVNRRAP